MGGFDDHVAIMGDWAFPSPSPRTFFSSMMNDDISSQPAMNSGSGNTSVPPFPRPEQTGNADKEGQEEARFGRNETSNSNGQSEQKLSSRGGLMERIAARGFNAPRLNTESMRPADLSKKPEVRSPYLTIPPGLSPTTLLESPVFLSNSLVHSSLIFLITKESDLRFSSLNTAKLTHKGISELCLSLEGFFCGSFIMVKP